MTEVHHPSYLTFLTKTILGKQKYLSYFCAFKTVVLSGVKVLRSNSKKGVGQVGTRNLLGTTQFLVSDTLCFHVFENIFSEN